MSVSAAEEEAAAEARRPFALLGGSTEGVARCVVVHVEGAARQLLLLTVHHVACDGASVSVSLGSSDCYMVNGTYTAAVTEDVETQSCSNNNGLCCFVYDETLKSLRTAVLIALKTPYCIGFIMAFFLNLILPEDSEEDGSQVSIQMTSTTSEA